MSATQELMRLDPCKSVVPFGDGTNHQFSHSDLQGLGDPTGISTEELEFLYGLVRILRPMNCLETGCNVGVSASAICLALRDNGRGHLTTIEHDGTVAEVAQRKLSAMGFTNFGIYLGEVSNHQQAISSYGGGVSDNLDFLWLDSELPQRFAELVFYFPHMKPGAIACIHDIWNLGFREFGPIPIELLELIKTGELRALTFQTPHGVTCFQKRRENDFLADISKMVTVEIHEQTR